VQPQDFHKIILEGRSPALQLGHNLDASNKDFHMQVEVRHVAGSKFFASRLLRSGKRGKWCQAQGQVQGVSEGHERALRRVRRAR
jgi:hypothetical protein